MPSVFETVTTVLAQGDNLSKLAGLLGTDEQQASSLAGAAAPAILGGVAEKASEPGGLGSVVGLLDGFDESLLGDVGGFLGGGDPQVGPGLLDGIFGASKATVTRALIERTGAADSTIARLLPLVAPLVVGVLAQRRKTDNLDADGLNALLGSEKAELERQGLISGASLGRTAAGVGAVATAGGVATRAAGGATTTLAGVGQAVGGAAETAAQTAAGSIDTAVGSAVATADAATKSAVDAGSAAASAARRTGGSVGEVTTSVDAGGRGRGFSWLPWVLAGLASVLILGWLLSQCGGSDDESAAGTEGDGGQAETSTDDATPGDEVADDDSAVGDTTDSGTDIDGSADTDGTDETPDVTVPTLSAAVVAEIQQAVNAALAASGASDVSGTVLGDGTVELSGTVDSEQTKAAAESALDGIDGITAVVNGIVIESPPEEQPTINEELSLDPITFEVSSAQITPAGRAVLDEAAEYLAGNPDVNVEIAGHTDSDGEERANQILSQARADSVKAYLQGKGVDGGRMTAKGYGESQPVASNDTLAGKAENRRIEFVIL